MDRQYILDEMSRTSGENSGKPLGEARFRKETGIGQYEWRKYWAKFSDLQREAGCEPNQPYTAYLDEFLIEKMIDKIRKFGKYPTLGELRVEMNNDVDFPFHAIKNRKEVFVKKIVEYCDKKNGYADVIDFCRLKIEKINKDEKIEEKNNNEKIFEVYLLKFKSSYKIGKTIDTVRRGRELRTQLPEDAVLIHSIKTIDPNGVEAYWHKRFEKKRGKGEWFNLNFNDVKEFKGWKRIV